MAIKTLNVTVTGIDTLLQSNPQVVDDFNPHRIALAEAIKMQKKNKTPENTNRVRELEIASKIFWDDKLGIYAPTNWLTEAIVCNSYGIAKIAKKKARSGVFAPNPKAKLHYRGEAKVKTPEDIICDRSFHCIRILPQGQDRICKATPSFSEWSFSTDIEYDDTVIAERELKNIIKYAATYGGFGDFRPTYGRATVEFFE